MIVAHDPGHGTPQRDGTPSSGVVANGITERDWTIQYAKDVIGSTMLPWLTHMILRSGVGGVSYTERGLTALRRGAQVVLCHHVNAHSDSTIDGLMTFVMPDDSVGVEVASAIARASPYKLRRRKGQVMECYPRPHWTQRAWNVMRNYSELGIPVVLVEWGFATSPVDSGVLQSERHRPAMIASCLSGMARAYEMLSGSA